MQKTTGSSNPPPPAQPLIENGDAPPRAFGVGDRVTWTHTVRGRHSAHLSTRRGKIVRITPQSVAIVQAGNNRLMHVPLKKLRHEGETTELTQAVLDYHARKDG